MNPIVLRAVACFIWMLCGLAQHDILGYLSALASVMFLIALVLEQK